MALATGSTGKFYSTNPGTEITSVTIADGASSASFNYMDEKAGTPKVTVTTEGLSSDEQIQTVVAAAANQDDPGSLQDQFWPATARGRQD